MSDLANTEQSPALEATQSKPSFSTLRNIHRRNREEIQDIFFNRNKLLPENRGLIGDTAKHATKKELEGDMDSLTGLLNKNGFNKRLQEAVNSRHNGDLFGIVLDADGLKAINDQDGHKAGDEYIKKIGQIFKKPRAGDFAGRTGGDEFIIVLQATTEEEIEAWWKRQNTLLTENNIRISGGAFKINPHNPHASLEIADQAMYAAKLNKANGKNNFMIAAKDANNIVTFQDYTSIEKPTA